MMKRSQPNAFIIPGRRKAARRESNNPPQDWDWLDAIVGKLDEDFVCATEEPVAQHERSALEQFFGSSNRGRYG